MKEAVHSSPSEEEQSDAARGAERGADCVASIKRAELRGLAVQEFAEDPVSCFRASGECVFDLEAIEQRTAEAVAIRFRQRTIGVC